MATPNMPRDGNSDPMQVLRPTGDTHRVALVAATSVASPALQSSTEVIRICGDSNVHYTSDGTASNDDPFLAAGAYEYVSVKNGDIPEFFDPGAGGGFIIVTEMA